MNQTLDLYAVLLWIAVVAVFGLFFWLVAAIFWTDIRRISAIIDGWPERRRQRLAREEEEGRPPAWKRAVHLLLQIVAVLGAFTLVWLKLRTL